MHGRALIQNSTWSERAMSTETVINYAFLRCKAAFKRATYGFLKTRHNFTMIIREANGFVVSPSYTNYRIQSSFIDVRSRKRHIAVASELLRFPWIIFPTAKPNQILLAARYNYHCLLSSCNNDNSCLLSIAEDKAFVESVNEHLWT